MQNRVRLEPYDWLTLRDKLPEEFYHLIDLCYQLEKYFYKINRIGISFITEERLRQIIDISERVIFEYKKFMQPYHDKVKKDLQNEYSLLFFGTEDSFLSKYIRSDASKRVDYLRGFLAQLYAMIHFRIYDSLAQIDVSDEVIKKFREISLSKTGIFEGMEKEEEEFQP